MQFVILAVRVVDRDFSRYIVYVFLVFWKQGRGRPGVLSLDRECCVLFNGTWRLQINKNCYFIILLFFLFLFFLCLFFLFVSSSCKWNMALLLFLLLN